MQRGYHTTDSGREQATEAAKAVGGTAIFPQFKRDEKGRDFTDFAAVSGNSTNQGSRRNGARRSPGVETLSIPSACNGGARKGNRMGRYGVAVTGLAIGAMLLYALIENCGWVLRGKPAEYCGDSVVARVVQVLGAGVSTGAVGALCLT